MCLDNFFTSTRSGIADLMGHPRFEFIRHDVTEPFYCECDMVYNMACPASPVHYQWNPIKTTKVSVLGTINMMGLAKRVKARILQASTSEIYGDPEVTPQSEEYWGHVNTIGVRSCYDEGKRVAETLAFDYLRSNNVDIRVARIFNTYGPGMHPYDGRVVSNFILQALHGEDITIYGDGSQTRSFGYVDDTVDGLIRLMNQEATIGPVNIGNPNEFTVKELAEMIIELTGSKSKIVFLPLPGDDPKQRRPNITRAKALLEWEPKVQLREGLTKTIHYFKALDLRKYSKPTMHNAHHNTMVEAKVRKRLSYALVPVEGGMCVPVPWERRLRFDGTVHKVTGMDHPGFPITFIQILTNRELLELHCCIRGADQNEQLDFEVNMSLITGQTIATLSVPMTTLLGELKQKVSQQDGTNPRQLQLLVPGDFAQLTDEQAVADLGPLESKLDLILVRNAGFFKSEKFEGVKEGYAFKLGEEGLGYYLDEYQKDQTGPPALRPDSFPKPLVSGLGPSMQQLAKCQCL
ncbi:UDP-glucuronic acid decarboxylase 1 (UDP-glucuronate decarboxylase 1) (UGD) (UXS-1) [Durusdinium trenchii]|uniref:UDP-glucuronate decarboxylase n=1 Tax=Durusdinium trenchii TaxID=1381693 RepID=A0ABP0K988_9DINO